MCVNGAQLIGTRRIEGALPVAIMSNSDSVAFSAEFGTATPTATVRVLNTAGEEIQVVVNLMGRVRSCSPTATLKALQAVC
jgi:type IV fimbrial biogenesis protein FimT